MTNEESKECESLQRRFSNLQRRARTETEPQQLIRMLNNMDDLLKEIEAMIGNHESPDHEPESEFESGFLNMQK
jgi:hypothetical protein